MSSFSEVLEYKEYSPSPPSQGYNYPKTMIFNSNSGRIIIFFCILEVLERKFHWALLIKRITVDSAYTKELGSSTKMMQIWRKQPVMIYFCDQLRQYVIVQSWNDRSSYLYFPSYPSMDDWEKSNSELAIFSPPWSRWLTEYLIHLW